MTTKTKLTALERTAPLLANLTGTTIDGASTCIDVDSRYFFDFALMPTQRWAQMDTEDDAPWFGMWTEPAGRRILIYAEGDITLIESTTDAEYLTELGNVIGFHQQNGTWKGIDAPYDRVRARLMVLGATGMLHRADQDAADLNQPGTRPAA